MGLGIKHRIEGNRKDNSICKGFAEVSQRLHLMWICSVHQKSNLCCAPLAAESLGVEEGERK